MHLSAYTKTITHPTFGNLPPEGAGSQKLGKEFCRNTYETPFIAQISNPLLGLSYAAFLLPITFQQTLGQASIQWHDIELIAVSILARGKDEGRS